MDFLQRLFDSSDFPARWHCGVWTSGHGWLHILSDLGVWSAYVAIPCVLGYFLLRRRDLPFRKIFLLFGAFIFACGTTHLMEAIIFWWPAYRLAGLIKLLTAVVSWATVFALVPVVPRVLAMRSPEDLEREVNARKEAEAALQRANDDLERRIEERTADLRRLTMELSEADRRKDVFLATLAHELRNPLAPLRNGLHVMKLAANDGEAVEQTRGMMERQLGQMVRLVDDLLDVSRITRNKLELRKGRVDLAAAVQSAIETSRPVVEQAGHTLSVALSPQPIYLDADLTRLAQVFSNLLNNAAKYTPPRGQITIAAEQAGDEAVVRVKDSGIGIPPTMLPQVFEVFTQVDRSLEKAQGGLGVGLTIVKRLVEMHGGAVEAKSEGLGQGSEFVVRLPVVASPTPGDAAPREEAGVPAPKRTVLVVDDNRDSAQSLSIILTLRGHEVRQAHDGLEAIEAARQYRPELILMDVGMPKLNGFDATRHIRQEPWGREVVIVALTGWGQEEDQRKSQEAGCDAHMVKPIDLQALEKLLAGLQRGAKV